MWFPYSHTTLQHQMRKKKKRFLTCLFWQCTKECFALAFIPACMFAETRSAQAFPISDPIKHHCGVTRRPDAGVLSSRRSRQGYGSPLKETSGWGCDHSLCWKTLPSSVFMTKYYWFQSILVIVHCLLKFPGSFNWGKLILYFLSWTMYNYNHMLM